MIKDVFTPADILLPESSAPETWSVIACDQFSAEKEYWERVRDKVGTAPSTLSMIIPEAYLDEIDENERVSSISSAMDDYIGRGLLRRAEDSFILVERTLPDGRVRRGLVGTVDLDEYDFSGADSAIRASEGTVLERLPARIRIRRAAGLELPHIMTFIDDGNDSVIGPLMMKRDGLPLLYDFELMEGGGHIRGMRVCGGDALEIVTAMRVLHKKNRTLMVIGDGNHSLAAAKVYWDELKEGLSEADKANHPAGRALVEVNNVYDPAISFEAIHRVMFDTDPDEFLRGFMQAMPGGNDYELRWVSRGRNGVIGVSASCIGDMLTSVQTFIDGYTDSTRCRVDYIHGADAAERLAQEERRIGLILPAMDKSELFGTVTSKGVFPQKSFSVGHARDKRYYLECRLIKQKVEN